MKTELLIVAPSDEAFCIDKKSFIDFLRIDSHFIISGTNISYRRSVDSDSIVSARFNVETDKVKAKHERYFLIAIECKDEDKIDEFSELCERVKVVCERISPNSIAINTLWDDIGRTYAKAAYPLINEVENLMRKLIAKFMLITVGMSWSKDSMQPELFKKIENFEGEQPLLNDLHKLDFIHLNQVLFEKKRDISTEDLDRVLLKTKFNEEDREKILKFIPRSNWEKHFSSLIDEKDSSLEKKWELLYKLRNKVAHNRHLLKKDFLEIEGLSNAIKKIISDAIAKLGEIDLTEEDRELIIHSYTSSSHSPLGYISEKAVSEYYTRNGSNVYALNTSPDVSGLDFIAEKEGQKVGVEVIAIHPKNFHSYITMIESRARNKEFIKNSPGVPLSKMHLVFVATVNFSDLQMYSMASYAEKFYKILGEDYELHLGSLYDDTEYEPFFVIPN